MGYDIENLQRRITLRRETQAVGRLEGKRASRTEKSVGNDTVSTKRKNERLRTAGGTWKTLSDEAEIDGKRETSCKY